MNIEQQTINRVAWRLLPLLMLGYFMCYIDRANIGVAALTMNADLGISPQAFGLGAGIFFLGYFLFEIPSNMLLDRFGARIWIARIMISWGILSGAMAFISGPTGFYVVRVLLGIAEAGFFPGVIFYLTLWFPAEHRAKVMGYFTIALPLSSTIGTPISASLLQLDGLLGIAGWRWMFLIEAIPSIILAVFIWKYLTDRPRQADWLPEEQRNWLIARMEQEAPPQRHEHGGSTIWKAITDWRVLAFSVVYFGIGSISYGLAFFMPQIVKSFGLTNMQTGFVAAIPALLGVITMIYWSRRSDKTGERRLHTTSALALAGIGMLIAAFFVDPYMRMLGLCLASMGVYAALPVFWTLPTAFLSGLAAAVGIAVINSIANISGFVGPYALGFFKETTGDYGAGLMLIGVLGLLAAVVTCVVADDTRRAASR